MTVESGDAGASEEANTGAHLGARWPELLMAAFLFVLAVMVIIDSVRVGRGWGDDGPKSGYFPFYIGLMLAGASSWIMVSQLRRWTRDTEVFAEHEQLRLVMAVLAPMVVYVALIFGIGIYIASALLIGYFMLRYGRYRWAVTLPVAIGVPLFFFLVFERWFLVLLPKGPLERLLGL